MREAVGDLFTYPADAVVVPVNWCTKKNGDAVMGAGVAKQAAERWPDLPRKFGAYIRCSSIRRPRVYLDRRVAPIAVVCFATKAHWQGPAYLDLIDENAARLVKGADHYGWQTVTLPRLGCGLGGLSWSDVKPVLERYLDDRFIVLTLEGEQR